MEQFIRYLYEYQQGKPSRNVGFVKVERTEEQTTVHIHGKGLQLGRETELRLYIFFMEDEAPVGIFQGMITNINPSVNYRLTFGTEDTGAPENYPGIQGIIMKSEGKRIFAAVWSDFPVNAELMREWEEPEIIPLTMTEAVREQVVRDSAEEEEAEDTAGENADGAAAEAAGGDREQAAAGQESENVSGQERHAEAPAEPEQETGTEEDVDEYITPSERQCKKICRQDIAMLPRCEWRLANNSFLLHGCYNYHHLMLVQEGDELWLGVPGIYHSKEAKAAAAFGFSRFMPVGELDAELGSDEKEPGEEFGYWCRRVRRMNHFSL